MSEGELRQPKFSEPEIEKKQEGVAEVEEDRKTKEIPEEHREYIKKPHNLKEKFRPLLLKSESRKSADPEKEATTKIVEIEKWHGWIHRLPLENLRGVLKYGVINPSLLEKIGRWLKDYYQYQPKSDGVGGEITNNYLQPIVFVAKLGFDPESKRTFNITNSEELPQYYTHLPVTVMCDLSRYDSILMESNPDYDRHSLQGGQ